MKQLLTLALLTTSLTASAELYRDISPLDSLGDVRARFPNAQVKRLTPAWAQATDSMYQFTGSGMSGTIIVKFTDLRPTYKKDLEGDLGDEARKFYGTLANQSDDEANSADWVRWIPESPFSIQRLLSKYGTPEKSDFSDENYQPYRKWNKKGVTAYLTDDEKNVVKIDFSFSKEEYRRAYLSKYKFVPQWLKAESTPPQKK